MQSTALLTRPLCWLSAHSWVVRCVPILFVPAMVMLLTQVIRSEAIALTTAALMITVALLLFCIELAWMAYVDLNNVAKIATQVTAYVDAASDAQNSPPIVLPAANLELSSDQRPDQHPDQLKDIRSLALETKTKESAFLNQFFRIVVSTIALELAGFYAALLSPPLGALIVIFSQLWFNLLAGVQLFPHQSPAIVPFGPRQRVDVLAANSVAIFLLCLWPIAVMKLSVGIGLLMLITLFLVLKYVPLVYTHFKKNE